MHTCDAPKTLIVGSKGMIGSALSNHLNRSDKNIIGADIAESPGEANYIPFDLAKPGTWNFPWKVKTAYICAGITKLDECRNNVEKTYEINVENTIRLAEILSKNGARIVFFSSNQVFDGTVPFATETTKYCPVTEYGRQKKDAETRLMNFDTPVAIVRLTKVLGSGSIINNWAEKLKKKEVITPFEDMYLAPIPLSTVISILDLIGRTQQTGIWQISGDKDVTYHQAAKWVCDVLKADDKLIKPIKVSDSGLAIEANPRHTTLDICRLKKTLGVIPPNVEWTIKSAVLPNE